MINVHNKPSTFIQCHFIAGKHWRHVFILANILTPLAAKASLPSLPVALRLKVFYCIVGSVLLIPV